MKSRPEILRPFFESLTDDEAIALKYDWRFWARPEQLPPAGGWRAWFLRCGRGWGKTRTGAETVRALVESNRYGRIGLIGRTPGDARDVMVEDIEGGPRSGLVAISPPWFKPVYEPSKRRLTWPNGATGTLYSSHEPGQLRGPGHDLIWGDEPSSWKYPETLDNAFLGLRLGDDPLAIFTSTPKPNKLTKAIIARAGTVETLGSTYDNVDNLARSFLADIKAAYEGTRLGRQELHGELLEDVEGALWTLALIDELRVREAPVLSALWVAVDPSANDAKDPKDAECGIAVGGTDTTDRRTNHGYLLEDCSGMLSPTGWAIRALNAWAEWEADGIVAEKNNGGEMVRTVIRQIRAGDKGHDGEVALVDGDKPAIELVTASRGKKTRAEPVAAKYEQRRIHHVGTFPEMEDQMTTWIPGEKSPDRMDANVWLWTKLTVSPTVQIF